MPENTYPENTYAGHEARHMDHADGGDDAMA